MALGAALRLVPYLANRPLWLDEALIALNLIAPPSSGLYGPLSFAQGAPPGFLWAQATLVDLLGPDERVLRLLPLVCGLGALGLFWPVARRLAGERAALVGLALFAVLAPVVYYASEAKQYSGDVLAALVLTGAAALVHERPRSARRAALLAGVGAAAVWFSHATLLVLGAAALVLGVAAARRRDRAGLGLLAGVLACWGASLAGAYVVSLRHLGGLAERVVGGDSPFSAPLPPASGDDLRWWVEAADSVLVDLMAWPAPLAALAGLLAALGAAVMWRRQPAAAALLVVPLPLALLASGLGLYPFGARFALFLAPAVVLLIALGGRWLVARAPRRVAWRALAAVPLVAVIGAQAVLAAGEAARPPRPEDTRPLLRTLVADWRPGDRLYVSHGAQYALRFYARSGLVAEVPWPIVAAPDDPAVHAPALRDAPPLAVGARVRGRLGRAVLAADVARLDGRRRVWVLMSHTLHHRDRAILRAFDSAGTRRRTWPREGASLHLYDLGGRGSLRARPPSAAGELADVAVLAVGVAGWGRRVARGS